MEQDRVQLVGKYAASLALVEVALGSLLHSFRVPLSGTFLSLNQGLFLSRAAIEAKHLPGAKRLPYLVSNVTAVLKSLAPAGKKLGPMLSLSMQGLLFTAGVQSFGINFAGLAAGMALLSLWTFLQPVITYYLFFGSELIAAFHYLFEKTLPYHGLALRDLAWILAGAVLLKVAAAVGLAAFVWKKGGDVRLQERLLEFARRSGVKPLEKKKGSPFWLALKDLFHPLFLISFAATALFLFYSQRGENAWILLRPLAVGFLFFYFSRTLRFRAMLERLRGTRWEGFARSCERAVEIVLAPGRHEETRRFRVEAAPDRLDDRAELSCPDAGRFHRDP